MFTLSMIGQLETLLNYTIEAMFMIQRFHSTCQISLCTHMHMEERTGLYRARAVCADLYGEIKTLPK